VEVVFALALASLVTGALWWPYFDEVADHSRRHIAESEDPGRLARDAYTYLHLPIVAGIIMVAVADDLLIAGPDRRLAAAGIVMTVGGPAIYLIGESLVHLRMISSLSPQRLLAVVGLGVLGVLGRNLSALALSGGAATILLGLTMWDHPRLRPRSGPFAWMTVSRVSRVDPPAEPPVGDQRVRHPTSGHTRRSLTGKRLSRNGVDDFLIAIDGTTAGIDS
jgi:low temperature requirement protein LtrA